MRIEINNVKQRRTVFREPVAPAAGRFSAQAFWNIS
jgi:hypothetical protein